MGYEYYGEGEITIHPPIPTDPPAVPADRVRAALFRPDITLANTVGNSGCDAIIPAAGIARKLGNPQAELQQILDTHGQGHRFDGEILFQGEDGDTATLEVVDGRAVWTWDDEDQD